MIDTNLNVSFFNEVKPMFYFIIKRLYFFPGFCRKLLWKFRGFQRLSSWVDGSGRDSEKKEKGVFPSLGTFFA